jgi:hypothetical protein
MFIFTSYYMQIFSPCRTLLKYLYIILQLYYNTKYFPYSLSSRKWDSFNLTTYILFKMEHS